MTADGWLTCGRSGWYSFQLWNGGKLVARVEKRAGSQYKWRAWLEGGEKQGPFPSQADAQRWAESAALTIG